MNVLHIKDGTDLTPIFKAHRTNTRFVLDQGMFYVNCAWDFDTDYDHTILGDGCELIGEGSTKTTLFIQAPMDKIPREATQVEGLTAGRRSGYCAMVRIEGLAIVAANVINILPNVGTIGLHVWSDNAVIRDIRVSNVVGSFPVASTNASREGFGVLLNASGKPARKFHRGHYVVRDIFVDVFDKINGPTNFVTGFYYGMTENPDVVAVCDNIVVANNGTSAASVAFGVNSKVLGTRWQSIGKWVRGIYCDVKGGSDVLVTNSILEVTSTALELQTGQGESWENIALTNSCIHFRPEAGTGYCAAIVLTDNAYKSNKPGSFSRIQIRESCLIGHSNGPVPFYAGGVNTPAATDCGLVRCKRSGVRWPGANLVPGATFLDE